MSVLVRSAPAGPTTTEQYDETIRRLEEGGDFPPPDIARTNARDPRQATATATGINRYSAKKSAQTRR